MKVKTIEIAWHRRPEANHNDPVLSVDFLDDSIFATGGGDHEVKIWRLNTTGEEAVVEYCYSLKGHQQSVNVVRFSPDKKLLASAGDDGCIIIWGLREKVCSNWSEITKDNCYWKKNIRGHAMDIYDISWCPNSQFLVSSGTDSNIIIWGIDGTQYTRIHDHTGYIQGVDWSQDDMNIISVANDRTARIYNYTKFPVNTKLQVDDWNSIRPFREDFRISKNLVNNRPLNCKAVLKRMLFSYTSESSDVQDPQAMENSESGEAAMDVEDDFTAVISTSDTPIVEKPKKEEKGGTRGFFMYLGDTVPSFYRRPHSSSDGVLTVIPCGVYLQSEGSIPRNCSYMYLNGVWEKCLPIACYPVLSFPTVVTRFSNTLYKRKEDQNVMSLIGLPYYHVFAVTTTEEVFVYSTQSTTPLFYISNIHYAQICDFAWNASGNCAFTVSSDGYCTLIQFEEGELGEKL
ncbi:CAF assembly factor complex subunit b [Blastocystis sp. subtype 4]|uniref:CAF assembly factor complex subunit b n=1 Tax=Blastocystis sp. subtype 4 TaxID=944170 RepID=UPI000711858F|nr:CAF assembly factor complex subunit b [Blastocystis sp. subtype 4]KNB44180.1 CAF assembly factor complex subunit b [Blastocystis sp. subtype 4]|eukprot:XP_014527623.1 CAF assembly factor complex subunit b [Blastocystis sp. subtype 4]